MCLILFFRAVTTRMNYCTLDQDVTSSSPPSIWYSYTLSHRSPLLIYRWNFNRSSLSNFFHLFITISHYFFFRRCRSMAFLGHWKQRLHFCSLPLYRCTMVVEVTQKAVQDYTAWWSFPPTNSCPIEFQGMLPNQRGVPNNMIIAASLKNKAS